MLIKSCIRSPLFPFFLAKLLYRTSYSDLISPYCNSIVTFTDTVNTILCQFRETAPGVRNKFQLSFLQLIFASKAIQLWQHEGVQQGAMCNLAKYTTPPSPCRQPTITRQHIKKNPGEFTAHPGNLRSSTSSLPMLLPQ